MAAPQPSSLPAPVTPRRITARAILVGERIDTAGLERSDMISTNPLAFRVGGRGEVVLFRYGAVVLIGLVDRSRKTRCCAGCGRASWDRSSAMEDETVTIEIVAEGEEQIVPGGPISCATFAAAPPDHRRCIGQERCAWLATSAK